MEKEREIYCSASEPTSYMTFYGNYRQQYLASRAESHCRILQSDLDAIWANRWKTTAWKWAVGIGSFMAGIITQNIIS